MYTNAALKSSCSTAANNEHSASSAARIVEGSPSLSGEQEGTAASLLRAKSDEDDERPLIILDMEESLSAVANETPVDADGDDMLVQNLLKEFLDHSVDDTVQSTSEDNDSELTDFERQVLSKYMKEMCEPEIADKSDAVCHLTTTDHQQERDPKQVIEFSPTPATVDSTENPTNDTIEFEQDQVNNNSGNIIESTCSTASQNDENANRIRIELSKLEAEPLPAIPVASVSSEPTPNPVSNETDGGQQPSFAISPTPKVTSDNSECTSTTIATATAAATTIVNSGSAQLANTHNTTSTIINCTAIPSTTSTTVAITNMSSTTSTYNQANNRGNQNLPLQQNQQQQQHLREQEELQQLQQQQQERSRAMRRNFSVWVGVTSCVWGILIYLIKSYT